jgi:hypothetical protein
MNVPEPARSTHPAQSGLCRRRVRAEEKLADVAAGSGVGAKPPDEAEELRVHAAFGVHRADAARAKRHCDLEQARDERVGGFLKGPTLHVAEAIDTQSDATVDLGDVKRWHCAGDAISLLAEVDEKPGGYAGVLIFS